MNVEHSLGAGNDDHGRLWRDDDVRRGRERSTTVSALTNVKLGVLTQADERTLTERDPALVFHFFCNIGRKIASDLRRANRDILKLTTAFCLALEGK